MIVYLEEINESEQVHTSTQKLSVVLDDIYKSRYLSKVMRNKCQHLTETQCKKLRKLFQNPEELFDVTLGT